MEGGSFAVGGGTPILAGESCRDLNRQPAGVFAITFAVALAITIPKVPVIPILAVLVPLMIVVPIVAYPFSKTIWMAVDRALLQHLDRNERLDERY